LKYACRKEVLLMQEGEGRK